MLVSQWVPAFLACLTTVLQPYLQKGAVYLDGFALKLMACPSRHRQMFTLDFVVNYIAEHVSKVRQLQISGGSLS